MKDLSKEELLKLVDECFTSEVFAEVGYMFGSPSAHIEGKDKFLALLSEKLDEVNSNEISPKPEPNKFWVDMERWQNSFQCKECGADEQSDFIYDRTVANGEVWKCKHCSTEALVGNQPNEHNY